MKYYVYKYTDQSDGIVKYVGMSNSLFRRIVQHEKDALKDRKWLVEFINVPSKADAEFIEGVLITKYRTYKYFNKAKADWGESGLFDVDSVLNWKMFNRDTLFEIASDIGQYDSQRRDYKYEKTLHSIEESYKAAHPGKYMSTKDLQETLHIPRYVAIEFANSIGGKVELCRIPDIGRPVLVDKKRIKDFLNKYSL